MLNINGTIITRTINLDEDFLEARLQRTTVCTILFFWTKKIGNCTRGKRV
jgi:hypothetical protein